MSFSYLLGILLLIVGIGLSVALHELGHMLPAKRFGVKVTEYFIGFGPKIWSTQRGETEYGVKAIWLGGYVRLVGMLPPENPAHPDKRLKDGSLGMVGQARAEALAEVQEGEESRTFYRLSVPKKLLVMAGGILTNLLLGIVLLGIAVSAVGAPTYTTTLSSVAECVPADVTASVCADTDPESPAAAAGFEVGDTILSWNGTAVKDWTDVQTAIASDGVNSVPVQIERNGETLTLQVTAMEVDRIVYDAAGQAQTDADGKILTEARPYVGIGPTLGTQRQSLTTLPGILWNAVSQTVKAIVTLPVGLYHAVAAGLGFENRQTDGVVGLVGMGRMAGEVTSAGSGTISLSVRVYSMLSLLGSLNLALFAFNLLPFLPLDGGHVVGALWEGIRRRRAQLRGEPDPGPVDTARMLPVGQAVFYLLVVMTLVLVWADIVAPI